MPSISVGTSPVALPDHEIAEVLLVQAASGNSGKIYVLDNSGVTANSTAATDGIQLIAGASMPITPSMCGRNSKYIYLVSDASSQTVFYWAR